MDSVENVTVKLEKMDVKDTEPHEDEELHSFIYSIKGKQGKQETLNCVRRQTIMDLLMTCPKFNENAKKNEGKELVIVRGEPGSFKAISTHFPCCLIDKEEHLVITYLKAKENYQPPNSVSVRPGTTRNDLVVFHVEKDGKILVNTALTAKQAKFLSVYAYKRETIEEALKRDGRFKSNFSNLKDIKEHNRTINISNPVVDDLNDKTFRVILDAKKAPQAKQSDGSVPSSSTNTSTTSTSSPHQSATHVPVNTDMPEHTAKQKTRPIADSEEFLALLRAQFPDLVQQMKDRDGKSKTTKELLRVEYGKSDTICKTVKMQKKLMVRADSVCQVRVEEIPLGSGFLLFDKFILTNAHVIEDPLRQDVTVSFCFEDLGACINLLGSVPVKPEVVDLEIIRDHSGCYHDWALLELDLELDSPLAQKCPPGLLENVVTSPQRGGICIIGHPGGGVKVTDPCFIIPVGDREKVVKDRYQEVEMQLITGQFFDLKQLVNQSPDLAYDTCFSYGSSGSPVFDESHNVVAMHTGGYVYKTEEEQPQKVHPQSFVEYAQPLSRILPRIIIKLVERQRFDVLEAYLHYTSIHKNDTFNQVKEDVRRIVETDNLDVFENELKTYAGNSVRIKEFIQFFCPQDEHMDTNLLLTATLLQDS